MRPSLARTLLPALAPLGLALLVAGCSTTEPDPVPEPFDPAEQRIDGILINHVESGSLVKAHFDAWSAKSAGAYDALLEKPVSGRGTTGFRFYVRDDDASQLPWVENGYWEYDVEMEIVGNMTNPNFGGPEPPVDTIEASYTVLSRAELGDGVERTTVNAVIQILVGPDTGWIADTRLEIVSAPDDDGFLRIRMIGEFEVFRRLARADASAEDSSFGQIKSGYYP